MFERVLVTGASGLVGTALKAIHKNYPNYRFVFTSRKDGDLQKEEDVKRLFRMVSPDYVIHVAASAGGIGKNLNSPAEQYYNNIMMNTHIIHEAHKCGVKKIVALSSVAAFSPEIETIEEKALQVGKPHPAFLSYGYSKRMLDIQMQAYQKQYNTKCTSIISGNIFGEGDNFNIQSGHVVPALIHKCYLARKNNTSFEVWGDGTPYREFIYSQDIATACINLLEREKDIPPRVIVSAHGMQIKELVDTITKLFDYYEVYWLTDKPNGQMKRSTSKEIFRDVFPTFTFTPLEYALQKTVDWFIKNYDTARK